MSTPSGHTKAICAARVIGTDVQDNTGQKIGTVKDVVLDKLSENIMFAAVSFGGFLGMAEKCLAVPWRELNYDEEEEAYVMRFTEEQLQSAPADSLEMLTRADGLTYREKSQAYYQVQR